MAKEGRNINIEGFYSNRSKEQSILLTWESPKVLVLISTIQQTGKN